MELKILLNPKRFIRHNIGDGVDFVEDNMMNNCWLLNRNTNELHQLVRKAKAVFCTLKDIEEDTMAYIRKEYEGWNLHANFRFWVYKADGSGNFPFEWTVQPDGRYWADEDGFGMELDREIIIHGYLVTP